MEKNLEFFHQLINKRINIISGGSIFSICSFKYWFFYEHPTTNLSIYFQIYFLISVLPRLFFYKKFIKLLHLPQKFLLTMRFCKNKKTSFQKSNSSPTSTLNFRLFCFCLEITMRIRDICISVHQKERQFQKKFIENFEYLDLLW